MTQRTLLQAGRDRSGGRREGRRWISDGRPRSQGDRGEDTLLREALRRSRVGVSHLEGR